MNEYKNIIVQLFQGSGAGLSGFAFGILFLKGLTFITVIKYAVVSLGSGAMMFYFAGQSQYIDYRFGMAFLTGWAGFFLIKGITRCLEIFSNDPLKMFKSIIELITTWKKK